jgi:GINS complex subunit 2
LERILLLETKADSEASKGAFTQAPPLPRSSYVNQVLAPPFVDNAVAEADDGHLPYHWLEIGEILLEAASDDLVDAGSVRRLMRDLREVRMAKMRAGVNVLEGTGILTLNGVGAMEVAEGRGFVSGVVDGLRKIGASREQAIKEREAEGLEGGNSELDDEDDYMGS